MKITRINVEECGVWSGLRLSGLGDGLSVIYGPNESGKSTALWFLRGVLFGFSEGEHQRFLPPSGAGGWIDVETAGGDLRIRRWRSEVGDDAAVVPLDPAGEPRKLSDLLGTVDEPTFANVFCLGLDQLHELRLLDDEQAAVRLYDLTGGLDRVSLGEVLRELKAEREKLLWLAPPEGQAQSNGHHHGDAARDPSQVEVLLHRRESLAAEIEALSAQGQAFVERVGRQRQLQEQSRHLQLDSSRLKREAWTIETALSLRDKWKRKATLQSQLETLGAVQVVPEGARTRLAFFDRRIARHRERLKELQSRWRTAREELRQSAPIGQSTTKPPVDATQLAELAEKREWALAQQDRIRALKGIIEKTTARLEAERSALPEGIAADVADNLSPDDMQALRPLAKSYIRARTAWKAAASGKTGSEARADHPRPVQDPPRIEPRRVVTARPVRGPAPAPIDRDVQSRIDRGGRRVADLKALLESEKKIEKLKLDLADVDEECVHLLHNQILPKPVFIGLVAAAALGAMFFLAAIFLSWGALAGILGLLLAAGAPGAKFWLERRNASLYDECTLEQQELKRFLAAAEEEHTTLDERIPDGGGPITVRLKDAEDELFRLRESTGQAEPPAKEAEAPPTLPEATAPEPEVTLATHRDGPVSPQDVEPLRRAMIEAAQRWREAVTALGLPKGLSPADARRLLRHVKHAARLAEGLARRQTELAEARASYAQWEQRLDAALCDAGLPATEGDLSERLARLPHVAGSAPQVSDPSLSLTPARRRLRAWRRQRGRLHARIRQLARRRLALYSRAGAFDRRDFAQRLDLSAQYVTLRDELASLNREIAASFNEHVSEAAVRELLERSAPADLQQRRDELLAQHEASAEKLRKCLENRAQVDHEIRRLADDRQLAAQQLELGVVEQQLRKALERWQVLAAASLLLDTIRHLYETERQPETLREASGHFARVTLGKYTRVWAPLGERLLRVDTADGQSVPIDVLSNAAREQLYLCLRLALVRTLERRGARLPLLLDDVLVNFDAPRARAAAEVLRDFAAQGRQVLLLTCHEHLCTLFRKLKTPVHTLDDAGDEASPAPEPADEVASVPFEPVAEPVHAIRSLGLPAGVWMDLSEAEDEGDVDTTILDPEEEADESASPTDGALLVEAPAATGDFQIPPYVASEEMKSAAAQEAAAESADAPGEVAGPPDSPPWLTISASDAEEFDGELRDERYAHGADEEWPPAAEAA
ncbi:MAG: AAA family ATPase [Planctomycetia bacterium]|nr:AAA family ATPase [Planctomycetia bacterium]